MTRNFDASRTSGPSAVVAIVGLLAAIVLMAFFAANDFDRRAIHWGRMHVVLMFVPPPLLGLVLLAIRRLHAQAVAYTAGIGSVAALALAMPTLLMVILRGFQTPEQRVDTVALAGYTLAMLVAAISAWIAHLRLPRAERRGRIVVLCAAGAGLYGLFGWGFFQTATRGHYDRAALIRDYNDRQAKKTITAIAECAHKQAAGNAQRGYPASMADLFAGGCLPKKLQRGQSNSVAGADGYAFYYYADPPDTGDKVARFVACARAESEASGARVIGIDTAGNLTQLVSPAWKPVASCFAVLGRNRRQALSECTGCVRDEWGCLASRARLSAGSVFSRLSLRRLRLQSAGSRAERPRAH